jgi:hypothetical protein
MLVIKNDNKSFKLQYDVAGEFPYAKCFICGEVGHLSQKCPDNPRGLYPNGGCCKECGSVEHLQRDCPEYQRQQGTLFKFYIMIFCTFIIVVFPGSVVGLLMLQSYK